MTQSPSPMLPAPLADYFARADAATALAFFASDAVVKDEGETHGGLEAIGAWLESVEARYRPRYRVLAADEDGEKVIVTFEVSGTFPGSPAKLRQSFVLVHDRIQRLETL